MDLKEYYFQNIKDTEYHHKFFDSIKNVNRQYNFFSGYHEVEDCSFDVYDAEEAINKFRELCQPENDTFSSENKCWFYLITYYLYKSGYEIKEFPRILARPPVEPSEFTYGEIRGRIRSLGGGDAHGVSYASRREYVASMTFEIKSDHVDVGYDIEQKFIEISNRQASFDNMSTNEKLAEIANLIENLLKKNGNFQMPDYTSICYDFISDNEVKKYRRKMQCFRHADDTAIAERGTFTDEQKSFFIDYGITLLKVIHALVGTSNP